MSKMSTTSTSSKAPADASDEAIRFVCNRDFHRSITLPPSSSHDATLRITFATSTNFSDASLPVILFCSPMCGNRYGAMEFDHLMCSHGVRTIHVDRPSMGGSTPVPLNQRFPVWLEAVTAILEKLETPHVYLACHSAGTLYALQTLWHLRGILWPEKPYVAFIAPWVHNCHSSAPLMNIASHIPSGVINGWDPLNRFIQKRVMPATSWSGGVISSVASLFQNDSASGGGGTSMTQAEIYGTSDETAEEIAKLYMKCMFMEDTAAVNEEAKICLRKPGVDWGVCADFGDFVQKMRETEGERRKGEGADAAVKLKVRAFFAESDIMIGKGGRDYFNEVWRENAGEEIDFVSVDLPETNHDSAYVDQKKGALKTVIRDIKALHYQ